MFDFLIDEELFVVIDMGLNSFYLVIVWVDYGEVKKVVLMLEKV